MTLMLKLRNLPLNSKRIKTIKPILISLHHKAKLKEISISNKEWTKTFNHLHINNNSLKVLNSLSSNSSSMSTSINEIRLLSNWIRMNKTSFIKINLFIMDPRKIQLLTMEKCHSKLIQELPQNPTLEKIVNLQIEIKLIDNPVLHLLNSLDLIKDFHNLKINKLIALIHKIMRINIWTNLIKKHCNNNICRMSNKINRSSCNYSNNSNNSNIITTN